MADQNLKTLDSKAFNDKVSSVISSIKGTPKELVALVVAAGYRYQDGKDSGTPDNMGNFVNALAEYPNLQAKAKKAFESFANLEFTQTEDSKAKDAKGGKKYTVKNLIKWADLEKTQKDKYKLALAAFEKANYDSLNDYLKSAGAKGFKYSSRSAAATRTVQKLVVDAIANGDFESIDDALNALLAEINAAAVKPDFIKQVNEALASRSKKAA
ncbi:hypothetical protein LFD09_004321 [Salmonella enterica]|nr:hypothetical protein [Salmonella enterica]